MKFVQLARLSLAKRYYIPILRVWMGYS